MIRLIAFATALSLAACDAPKAVQGGDGPEVTMAQFNELKTGMTKAEVESVVGSPGVEQSSNELAGIKTEMLAWNGNSMGGNMNVMFQNGKMVSKSQFGLQ